MKNILSKISFIVLTIFIFSSCEDVVDIPLDSAQPKLVIDAVIKWQKGTTGDVQKILLSTTTNFYSPTVPPATGADVYINDKSSLLTISFVFTENPLNPGEYICPNFMPVIGHEYELNITYNGQVYQATDTLMASPPIIGADQTTQPGFGGDDVIQVKVYYQDNGAEDNFYLVGVKNPAIAYPEYGVISDEFFQGNQMFGLYIDDKIKAGDTLDFSLQAVNFRFSNYMDKLLNISGSSGGSPFATPPATLRGNIINKTNESNYPYGYFALGEIDTLTYTVQ